MILIEFEYNSIKHYEYQPHYHHYGAKDFPVQRNRYKKIYNQ